MQDKLNYEVSPPNSAKMEVINADYQILQNDCVQYDEESPSLLPINHEFEHNNRVVNRRWLNMPLTWLMIVLGTVIAISAIVIIKRFAPSFAKKEVIPVVLWLIQTCSPPVLAAILFAAIALCPLLLLPTVQFKWIVGMTFGYGIGFLLIMAAVTVAVSLPYFIAYYLFLHKIEKWLIDHPEKAAFVKFAGEGDWSHQFRFVALLRLSPFPYVVFNYVAVVTGVKYSSYLVGTLIGMVPEVLLAMYSGKLFRTVAQAMEEHTHVSKYHLIFDGIGFCLSAVSTIAIGFYAKRRLKQLQEVEEQQQLR
ncbi:Golgi apparatus membrane protein TVP38-like [Chenopodium quinoa]|nr:Golgi apparatus membrane protein TVP38-like [Chenopodium quinoa]